MPWACACNIYLRPCFFVSMCGAHMRTIPGVTPLSASCFAWLSNLLADSPNMSGWDCVQRPSQIKKHVYGAHRHPHRVEQASVSGWSTEVAALAPMCLTSPRVTRDSGRGY